MAERIRIENLYKIFSDRPDPALARLRAGADKAAVLAETGMVVGLNDVSLSVQEGEMYMIMGLSGSGKSTLARCVNRLNEPTAGAIFIDGQDIVPLREAALRDIRRRRLSMVFQHFALLPNKSVVENVEFGLKLRGTSARERRRTAEEVLAVVGLDRWGAKFPHELSGGMRQRVGLARALATDADILIMDEAFSALDPLIRTEMQDELMRLQKQLRKTILFITHDFQEALKLGTRIAIMADGKLVREGAPQSIVLDPGSDYVAGFTRDVDRARLFDAGRVMTPGRDLGLAGGLRLVGVGNKGTGNGGAGSGGASSGGVALDPEGRVVRVLSAEDLRRLLTGADLADLPPGPPPHAVRAETKLVEIARHAGGAATIPVVDAGDRFVGILASEDILAWIGGVPAMAAPEKELAQ